MTVISGGDAVKLQDDELTRIRVENARLSSENARLRRELNEQKRLLWDRSETASAKEIEDFKERRSVWAYLARRGMELVTCFRKSAGTLPRFESMTAMLRHSVSTAAEMNLLNNPDIADAEKEALQQAYADQLRFIQAVSNLKEPVKRRILEGVEKEESHLPPYEIEAAVLVCYEELTERRKDGRMDMAEAQQVIAARLHDRTPKAIEAMITRARNTMKAIRAGCIGEEFSRTDGNAIAGYVAYHRARLQLRQESGDVLTRIRRLLSRFK